MSHPSGQNPYDPARDQSPYGQPYDPGQADQSAYGQNPYGQDAYGQSPSGQAGEAGAHQVDPYQQDRYQQSPYWTGGAAPQPHPQGTLVLVLGILGFFVAGVCAPFAWYLGSKALREIRASGVPASNEQLIVVGRVLGIIMTILLVLAIVLFIGFTVLVLAGSAMMG